MAGKRSAASGPVPERRAPSKKPTGTVGGSIDNGRSKIPLVHAALGYAAEGWRVFPIHTPTVNGGCSCGKCNCKRGKHPRIEGGFKNASSDPEQIREWWRKWPNANIGGVPGTAGFVVLDVDPDGEELAARLHLPPTREARTGRGRHLYYHHPGGTIGNKGPGPGIDVRADHGYVLLPPSLHPNGRRYAWTDPAAPVAPYPSVHREAAEVDPSGTRTAAPGSRAGERFANDLGGEEGAEEGARNNKLFSHLCKLRNQGANHDQLLQAAHKWNDACSKPLEEDEVRETVKSAAKYPSVVDQLNQRYAYALVGNKECVLEEGTTADGMPTLEVMSLEAFRGWHREFTVEGPTNPRTGKPSRLPLANFWLNSPYKRKYRTIEFAPPPLRTPSETYNLFLGWSVEPDPSGDCSLFLDHLRLNVCQNDDTAYSWVLGWFAQMFQQPAHKLGTSLALRGKQGVGKSKVGEVIRRLLGPYHFTASSPHQVTGHFNAHLRSILLLQAEEAFWAGDKAAEGVLKDMITSDTLRIEFKGKDILPVRNCIRLLVTSNADWVVPADFNDRRFTTLDVGEGRIRDFAFFKAMDEQLANGGYAALMHVLLEHEYDEKMLRTNLDTKAAREQKLHSLSDFESWIVDVATEGRLPEDLNGTGDTVCSVLHVDYMKHAQAHRARRILNATAFGIQLAKLFGEGMRRYRARHGERLAWKYVLPELPAFRAALLDRLKGLDADWDLGEAWEPSADVGGQERGQNDRE